MAYTTLKDLSPSFLIQKREDEEEMGGDIEEPEEEDLEEEKEDLEKPEEEEGLEDYEDTGEKEV